MKIVQFKEQSRRQVAILSRFCDAEMGDFRHILSGRGARNLNVD